ncbi:MAG: hypothetical protein P8078_06205 [bacterium]
MKIEWRRLRSGAGWGFFYGIITWLLATGITNDYSNGAVWSIILSRTLMGALIVLISFDLVWWIRAGIIGLGFNIIMGAVIAFLGYGWNPWFWPLVISGIVFAILTEFALRKKYDALSPRENKNQEET